MDFGLVSFHLIFELIEPVGQIQVGFQQFLIGFLSCIQKKKIKIGVNPPKVHD
jgi:hypothetical protein